MGVILKKHSDIDSAEKAFLNSIKIDNKFQKAYFNLGNLYKDKFEFQKSIAFYKKAISLTPNDAKTYANLGNVYYAMNDFSNSLIHYNKAIELDPNLINAYHNKSFLLLTLCDYENGWPLYEYRNSVKRIHKNYDLLAKKLWKGKENLKGKTIYIVTEQGLGDNIQFCRYLFLVKKLGAKIILKMQKPLYTLMESLDVADELLTISESDPKKYDYFCPLLSLPLAFKTTLETIPYPKAYIIPYKSFIQKWIKKIKLENKIPNIGIVWNGSGKIPNDQRSVSLEKFISYLPSNFNYISLQKEMQKEDLEYIEQSNNIQHFTDEIEDFMDTSAICSLVDLVITIDTSVAHLSAAMGKETWIILPFNSDWRWLRRTEVTPWYLSVRLFRNKKYQGLDTALSDMSKVLNVKYSFKK